VPAIINTVMKNVNCVLSDCGVSNVNINNGSPWIYPNLAVVAPSLTLTPLNDIYPGLDPLDLVRGVRLLLHHFNIRLSTV
jgi:hypothetical protein